MKTEVMSVSEFLHRKPESVATKLERHFKKYGFVYKIAGVTVVLLSAGSLAFASTGIDAGAKRLYYELVRIGKWIIIFKGGIDTIKAVGNGDVDSAKKTLFSHLIIYLILLGLPYGMDKVDEVFRSMTEA